MAFSHQSLAFSSPGVFSLPIDSVTISREADYSIRSAERRITPSDQQRDGSLHQISREADYSIRSAERRITPSDQQRGGLLHQISREADYSIRSAERRITPSDQHRNVPQLELNIKVMP
ncbi:hypothetical protein RRG08_009112 [Elysia crispata]|uniref:Uncharacterized protein n=1 Tax=Elysia crispata TaxID=231223 RepID=A0AAE1D2M2_9GAST|nr:hypothetical protein RRG08_009112 [Elysia crispata]